MKKFEIIERAELYSRYIVEANSEEEAREKFLYEGGEHDANTYYDGSTEIEEINEIEEG